MAQRLDATDTPRDGDGAASEVLAFTDASLADFLGLVRGVLGGGAESDGARGERGPAPARVRRFEVLGELGAGSFGVVLRVRDTALGVDRAMKLPHPRTRDDPKARASFLAEARHAALVDHPNVVRMFEADEAGPLCYQIMEYCPGGSLSAWLKARTPGSAVPARWAALLVAEIAEGVAALHARGIVHRDLKPANVLLVASGDRSPDDPPSFRPKVADFGLARASGPGAADLSADGGPVGTLACMSPEAALGVRAAIGPAADVYSLGTILFELLTGRKLYPSEDRLDGLAKILGAEPSPTPRSVRPGLPAELDLICQSCLSKDPAGRYATAAALAEDLRRYHRGDPVRGTPLPRRAWAWARRHARGLTACLAVAAGLALAAAGARYKSGLEADAWLDRVEAANLGSLPALVRGRDPADPRVSGRLKALFRRGGPAGKVAAAVALAPLGEPYADYAYTRLLDAEPAELGPIAGALDGRLPGLVDRLRSDVGSPAPAGAETDAGAEARDVRRANAAAALVLLGRPGAGLALLRSATDPRARSWLIHRLGPAGVSPAELLRQLRAAADPSVRLALVQALGEVPDEVWASAPAARGGVEEDVLRLYRDDPHPGVHGSAKWLLRKWGSRAALEGIDEDLAGRPAGESRWRIHSCRLTFVRFDGAGGGRAVEVSDTEVPRDLFLKFKPDHQFFREACAEPDGPIVNTNYLDGAAFCNRLSDADGLPRFYTAGPDGRLRPADVDSAHPGFRLPTDAEFARYCAAGSTTRWYHGDSPRLLPHYAWYGQNTGPQTHPAACKKPNDQGLFDTLGHAMEVCQATGPGLTDGHQAVACGGSLLSPEFYLAATARSGVMDVDQPHGLAAAGFRVARTLGPPPPPPRPLAAGPPPR